MSSTFREIIEFFDTLGIYDVVLPFLLVFTICFAIFEKTRIFGMEKYKDQEEMTRKNLNSLVSFIIAFFVVASSELVRTINEAMANMVLLLLLSVSFMLLVGSFHKSDDEFFLKNGKYKNIFMALMFVGIIGIFLHAIHYNGQPFLEFAWDYLVDNFDSNAVGSVVLLGILVGFIFYIQYEPKPNKNNESSSDSE